jgi:Putative beta-barrel porin 2
MIQGLMFSRRNFTSDPQISKRMNYKSRTMARMPLAHWKALLGITTVCATLGCQSVKAEMNLVPYVGARYENNSNIFAVSSEDDIPVNGQKYGLGDSTWDYFAGLDMTGQWDRQKLAISVKGDRIQYDQYKELDNTAYSIDGRYNWAVGSAVDGDVGYTETHQLAPFEDRNGATTGNQQQTEKVTLADFRLLITPEWRAQPYGQLRDLDSPQAGYEDFNLRERTGGLKVEYLGVGRLRMGIDAQYLNGEFHNGPPEPEYTEKRAELTANYAVTGLSSFVGAIGYLNREQGPDIKPVSGIIGELGYTRQLTGKTSIDIHINRDVNTYVAAGSTEVDGTGTLGVSWSATRKVTVGLTYRYIHSRFAGNDFLPGVDTQGRTDDMQSVDLTVDYAVMRWLSLRPFYRYEDRASTIDTFAFHGSTFGLQLQAHYDRKAGVAE